MFIAYLFIITQKQPLYPTIGKKISKSVVYSYDGILLGNKKKNSSEMDWEEG